MDKSIRESDAVVAEIRKEALRVLSGADGAQTQLLKALELGPVSLSNNLYAIRSRVKSQDSLVKKILKKRAEKPTYNASDVTDIVGLRLLCLHSQEMPSICRKFMEFVKFGLNSRLRLFSGIDLQSCIQEVVIYKSKSASSAYDSCFEYFVDLLDHEDTAVKPELCDLSILDNPRAYSSAHIVLNCYSYSQGIATTVPLEVQIRTALEDIWGEIQHRLEYKAGDISFHSDAMEDLYKSSVEDLSSLKSQIDASGEYADRIRKRIDRITSTSVIDPKGIFFVDGDLVDSRIPHPNITEILKLPELSDEFSRAEVGFQNLHKRIKSFLKNHDESLLQETLASIDLSISEIGNLFQKYQLIDYRRFDADWSFYYIFKMEEAHCLFWKGRLLKISGSKEELADKCLREAISIYREIERQPVFRADPVVRHRLAYCLIVIGRSSDALDFARKAVKCLNRYRSSRPDEGVYLPYIDDDHLYSIIIRKFCSYVSWVHSEQITEDAISVGGAEPAAERQSLLTKALESNLEVINLYDRKSGVLREDFSSNLRNMVNDTICYAADLVSLSGGRSVLMQLKVDTERLLATARKLGVGSRDWTDAHTWLLARCYFGAREDRNGIVAEIEEFRSRVENQTLGNPTPAPEEDSYMLRTLADALQYVETGQGGFS